MRRHLILPLIAILGIVGAAGCSSRPVHGMRAANPDKVEVVFTDGTAVLVDKTAKPNGTQVVLEALPSRHSWPIDVLSICDELGYNYYHVVDGSGVMKDAIFAGFSEDLRVGCAELPKSDVVPERTIYLVARKQTDGSWIAEGLPVMRFASLPEEK